MLAQEGGSRWHFFISHTQRNGVATALAADIFHELKSKEYACWLDVKMEKQDIGAMKEGVVNSQCVIAIITGGEDEVSRYFNRPMCVQELRWAIEAGKNIIPVVVDYEKKMIGDYIKEGQAKCVDLASCDFKHVDRSNPDHMHASLNTTRSSKQWKSQPKQSCALPNGTASSPAR